MEEKATHGITVLYRMQQHKTTDGPTKVGRNPGALVRSKQQIDSKLVQPLVRQPLLGQRAAIKGVL